MRNPAFPTRDEIREWAFSSQEKEPDPAWQLHLAHAKEYDLYVLLAVDESCPKATYFLRLLYDIVGRLAHAGLNDDGRSEMETLMACCAKQPRYSLHLFVQRTRALLNNPAAFIPQDWYGSRWVDHDLDALTD